MKITSSQEKTQTTPQYIHSDPQPLCSCFVHHLHKFILHSTKIIIKHFRQPSIYIEREIKHSNNKNNHKMHLEEKPWQILICGHHLLQFLFWNVMSFHLSFTFTSKTYFQIRAKLCYQHKSIHYDDDDDDDEGKLLNTHPKRIYIVS